MEYYYKTRLEAQTVADEIAASDTRIAYAKVELEINNGWVVALIPAYYDLREYGARFEVRDYLGRRITARPESHKRYAAQGAPQRAPRAAAPATQTVKSFVVNAPEGALKLPWMK